MYIKGDKWKRVYLNFDGILIFGDGRFHNGFGVSNIGRLAKITDSGILLTNGDHGNITLSPQIYPLYNEKKLKLKVSTDQESVTINLFGARQDGVNAANSYSPSKIVFSNGDTEKTIQISSMLSQSSSPLNNNYPFLQLAYSGELKGRTIITEILLVD